VVDLLVIADDLTGASETGAQFAGAGLPTVVSIDPEPTDDAARVRVVDTESRHVSPEEAARRVEYACRRARQAGVQRFYKKADSTLRGNVGAELAAMMRATGARVLPFIPAYPAAGRTTRGGCQFVHGEPLERTSLAHDPLSPIDSGSIAEIVARQSAVETVVVAPGRMPEAGGEDLRIWAFDAESEDDLDRIAAGLQERGLLSCCAGAAGFAECVARRLGGGREPAPTAGLRGPLLFVNGSLHETALEQVRRGIESDVEAFRLEPEAVSAGAGPGAPAPGVVEEAAEALRAGRDVLLCTVTGPGEDERYVDGPPRAVAAALGALAAGVVRRSGALGALAVFGGETAISVLRALGRTSFRPRRRLWPGVIECSLSLDGREVGFITKCGGFGPEDLVLRLRGISAGEET